MLNVLKMIKTNHSSGIFLKEHTTFSKNGTYQLSCCQVYGWHTESLIENVCWLYIREIWLKPHSPKQRGTALHAHL